MLDYIKSKVLEVITAIFPLILLVVIIQFAFVKMPVHIFLQFLIGAVMVIIGMLLFLFGVEIGILPVGKALGAELPRRGSLPLIIALAFLIGFASTIAEPDVIVLARQVDIVSGGTVNNNILVYIIAIGVAFFVAMAMLRTLLGFPITYLIASGYVIIIIMAFFTPPEFVPVSFDSGGVTTGPMTVPIILSLGLGFSSVLAGKSAMSDGFGLIGLASIGPIIGVMIMGMVLR